MMQWSDAHAHLSEYSDQQLVDLLEGARKNSVGKVINTGINLEDNQRVLQQVPLCEQLYAAVGVSPFDVVDLPPDWIDRLREQLQHPGVVALGEIGLDGTGGHYPALELQKEYFTAQLQLARQLELPAVMHSRGAEELVYDICCSVDIPKAVFHCYTGPVALVPKIISRGWLISYSGIATFKKQPLREHILATAPQSIVVETDSPYCTPHPHRGKKNTPAYIPLIGEYVAGLKEISPHTLCEQIEHTMQNYFFTRG